MKKLSVITIIIILTVSSFSIAVNAETDYKGDVSFEKIIESQVCELMQDPCDPSEFSIIAAADPSKNPDDRDIANEYALQIVKNEESAVSVTTVYPYKQLESGELINSFKYVNNVKSASQMSSISTHAFVDAVVTTVAYYTLIETPISSSIYPAFLYQPTGVTAYWNSGSMSTVISGMLVYFDSEGDLYRYPACQYNFSANLIQTDYLLRNTILKSSPSRNQVYSAYASLPSGSAQYLSDYLHHLGLVYVQIICSANGVQYTDDRCAVIYSK